MSKSVSRKTKNVAGILFFDIEGFSKLNPYEMIQYVDTVLPAIAAIIDPFRTRESLHKFRVHSLID